MFAKVMVLLKLPYIANRSRWKSFAIVQFAGKHSRLHGNLVWPNPIALAISLEKFRGYRSIRENCETFPPQTICNIRYVNLMW